MDTLSRLLESVRFEGARFFHAELSAPWSLRSARGRAGLREPLRDAEQIVCFLYVVEGNCKVKLQDSSEELEVVAGDLALFPRDDDHVLGSHLHVAALDADNLRATDDAAGTPSAPFRYGGGGEVTRVVFGYLACGRNPMRSLLETLPRVMRIPGADGQGTLLPRELLRIGARETAAARPGMDSTLARLADLMFVDALRRHAENLPPEDRSWFSGLRDARIGRALALMHAEPGRAWTLEKLAHSVALSRSALADRFATLVGEPPMQHLTRWRLALAARALRAGDPIVRVAERYGYESDAAFSRAFKREFGVPPATWRRAGNPGIDVGALPLTSRA
jgi:AraC-like DNA-binding protein